jgi:hypothetical protein
LRRIICVFPPVCDADAAYNPLAFIITADTTHVTGADGYLHRRIYTDGRDWPTNVEPSRIGHSIGRWIDEGRRQIRYARRPDPEFPWAARFRPDRHSAA